MRIEWRDSDDLWHGRQPKYDSLVRLGPDHFALMTKLPSGKPVSVRLGPLSFADRRTT